MKTKTKKIVFRCEESLHDFLKQYSTHNNMSVSELIRNVIIYFHIAFLVGDLNTNMKDLQNKFHKMYKSGDRKLPKLKKLKNK